MGYILYGSYTCLFVSIYLLNFVRFQMALSMAGKKTLCPPVVLKFLICGENLYVVE